MRIAQDIILAIEESVNVVEVLGDFLSLERKGKKYLCPFHEDKKPSFSITADGKFYKCFSCDAKGNAVGYLMEYQGMSYREAIAYLASRYGIAYQMEQGNSRDSVEDKIREALYILLERVSVYYREQLTSKGIVMDYLRERGLGDRALIKKFGLGYSQVAWRALYEEAKGWGYDDTMLEKAGLILSKAGEGGVRRYDRFRDRLIFSLYDSMGRVIGFAGRRMGSEEVGPKYINSPETPVYQKGHILYGLSQGKQAIRRMENCYIVEGYTDVLAMHVAGIENVVGSSGTALTKEQVSLIRRYTSKVTLLFDGDVAGQQATLRGIDLLLAGGCDVKIICLPSEQDPDSMRRSKGDEALKDYLEKNGQDFIVYKSKVLFEKVGDDPVKKAGAIHEILTTLAMIPDPLKRLFYVELCSKNLGISESLLQGRLRDILYKRGRSVRVAPKAMMQKQDPLKHLERAVLYMLMHHATYAIAADKRLADYLFEELADFSFSDLDYQALWDHFKSQWHTQGPITGELFIGAQGRHLGDIARGVMKRVEKPSQGWRENGIFIAEEQDNLATAIAHDVKRLQRAALAMALKENFKAMQEATTEEEKNKHFLRYQDLIKRKYALGKALGMGLTDAYFMDEKKKIGDFSKSGFFREK